MKKILIILTSLLVSFSASAQYYDYEWMKHQKDLQVELQNQFSDVKSDATLRRAFDVNSLQEKVNKDKAWFFAGVGTSLVGGITYLIGLDQIKPNYSIDRMNNGATISYIGCAVGAIGGVISTLAGITWSQDARDLRMLQFMSSGANVGVVYSF